MDEAKRKMKKQDLLDRDDEAEATRSKVHPTAETKDMGGPKKKAKKQDLLDRDDEAEATRSKVHPTAEKVGDPDDIAHAAALYKDQWKDRRIADYDKNKDSKRAKEMRADAEVDRKRMYAMDPNWKHAKYSTGEVKGKKSIKGNPKEEVEVGEQHPAQHKSGKLKKGWKMTASGEPIRTHSNPGVLPKRQAKRVEAGKNEEVSLVDASVSRITKQFHEDAPGSVTANAITVNQYGGADPYNIQDPGVLKRVNAFVGSIADREYLIPENAVHQLKGFLERIGISFETPQLPDGNGSVTVPLTRYGGVFGKSADTPFDEFDTNDGIDKNLNIQVEALRNSSWKVYAKIV